MCRDEHSPSLFKLDHTDCCFFFPLVINTDSKDPLIRTFSGFLDTNDIIKVEVWDVVDKAAQPTNLKAPSNPTALKIDNIREWTG